MEKRGEMGLLEERIERSVLSDLEWAGDKAAAAPPNDSSTVPSCCAWMDFPK